MCLDLSLWGESFDIFHDGEVTGEPMSSACCLVGDGRHVVKTRLRAVSRGSRKAASTLCVECHETS